MFFQLSNRSYKWKKVREDHIKKQPFCQSCGRSDHLEVHHIEPVHLNPDRELDPSNLVTLCSKNCHLAIGHLMDYNSWNINVLEDAAVYLNKVQNRPYKIKVLSNESNSWIDICLLFIKRLFGRHY